MYLIQYILKMPRQQFVKEEIVDGLRIVLFVLGYYIGIAKDSRVLFFRGYSCRNKRSRKDY